MTGGHDAGRCRCAACGAVVSFFEIGEGFTADHQACGGRLRLTIALAASPEDAAVLTATCEGCGRREAFTASRAAGLAALRDFEAAGTAPRPVRLATTVH